MREVFPAPATVAECKDAGLDLTIVIPAFRCAPYLAAAVERALHSAARHILIAEGSSGDDSLKVAERFAAAHPGRVRVLASPVNRGAAANVNEAAREIETRSSPRWAETIS
jgi:CDP-glycerol glycerophosphotransferase